MYVLLKLSLFIVLLANSAYCTSSSHCPSTIHASISLKSFLIVGGTHGLGYAAALKLAECGAQSVVVVGRSEPPKLLPRMEFVRADLSLMKATKALFETTLRSKRFDTMIISVGIFSKWHLTRTEEGLEEDLAVSYLSRFVIVKYLMEHPDFLVGSKRVFLFGYPGKGNTPTDVNDMNFEYTSYGFLGAHFNTVVYNEALVISAQRHAKHTGAKFYGLNPGLIATGIRQNVYGESVLGSWMGWLTENAIAFIYMSADQYAKQTLIPLFEDDNLPSGTMYDQYGHVLQSTGFVTVEANQDKIWKESEKLVTNALLLKA